MLVLKRREGQWLSITHSSGDVIRVRVTEIQGPRREGITRAGDYQPAMAGSVNLVFDDAARNFEVERPERKKPADPIDPA